MFEIKSKLDENPRGFYKITDEEYFARPEISNSDLNQLWKSPKAFKYYKDFGGMTKTAQMELGSIVHTMYLEPECLESRYIRAVEVDKRTKAGKEFLLNFNNQHKEKTIISGEILDKAQTIVESLFKNVGTVEMISGSLGYKEVSAFWEFSNVRCRGKIDYPDGYIYDLKTTSNLQGFEKSIANYAYHRQGAFYSRALSSLTGSFKGFRFIVVETSEPFDSAVFELDLKALRRGLVEIEETLKKYVECSKKNLWPSAYDPKSINILGLPSWY